MQKRLWENVSGRPVKMIIAQSENTGDLVMYRLTKILSGHCQRHWSMPMMMHALRGWQSI